MAKNDSLPVANAPNAHMAKSDKRLIRMSDRTDFRPIASDAVNRLIRLYQDHLEVLRQDRPGLAAPWQPSERVALLNAWAEKINYAFGLALPPAVISVEDDNASHLGSYRAGRNGLAIDHVININLKHAQRPLGSLLATLAHEMLHMWQHFHGAAPTDARYHNKQFMEKSRALGLMTNARGEDLGVVPGLFTALLERHGVEVECTPALELLDKLRKKKLVVTKVAAAPPLVRWCCGCSEIWAKEGVRLHIQCQPCEKPFEVRPEKTGPPSATTPPKDPLEPEAPSPTPPPAPTQNGALAR